MENDCWNILGIEPTEDKKSIKKAYRILLKHHHPEDDPEGFQRLKEAYDDALSGYYSPFDDYDTLEENDIATEQTNDSTQNMQTTDDHSKYSLLETKDTDSDENIFEFNDKSAGEFIEKITILIEARKPISLDEWKIILQDDALWNIDFKESVSYSLFQFMANGFEENNLKITNLPTEIWQLLDQTFDWKRYELFHYLHDDNYEKIYNRIRNQNSAAENLVKEMQEEKDDTNYFGIFFLIFMLVKILIWLVN